LIRIGIARLLEKWLGVLHEVRRRGATARFEQAPPARRKGRNPMGCRWVADGAWALPQRAFGMRTSGRATCCVVSGFFTVALSITSVFAN
jgi:hypothetical protein